MKKNLSASAFLIMSIYLVILGWYYISTPDKKIARRAFSIGGWSACQMGPCLWDRHMANVSYLYFYFPGRIEKFHQSGRGLIATAIGVYKCAPDEEWAFLDLERVKRGIKLGLDHGESINQFSRAGIAAIHGAVAAGSGDLLEFIIDNGGDTSLKTDREAYYLQEATPLEMAKGFQDKGMRMDAVIAVLEKHELNK